MVQPGGVLYTHHHGSYVKWEPGELCMPIWSQEMCVSAGGWTECAAVAAMSMGSQVSAVLAGGCQLEQCGEPRQPALSCS